ncbi:MAG: translation initiation factor IF-2 [Candidatus Omnitrophica bacterium]|nr:translation initiation factor IF-2 [Candidatus Omnitrophota bacterium]
MNSMKISDLAKKIKVPSKELLIQAVKLGIKVKSIQSPLANNDLDRVITAIAKKKPALNVKDMKEQVGKAVAAKKKTAKKVVKKKPETGKKKAASKAKKPAAKKKPSAAKKPAKAKEQAVVKEEEPKESPVPVKETVTKPAPEPVEAAVKEEVQEEAVDLKPLQVNIPISVKDLSAKMNVGVGLVIKALMGMKMLATINQVIDEDEATAVAKEFGYALKRLPTVEEKLLAEHEKEEEKAEDLLPRPPVVTFMGHVDHGKTSLLDYIRQSKITDQEKGGITQHIGAYEVSLDKGKIAFLDTPGHEAFTAMRARGANATDIVILVVAADDGIMPQTTEAIDHARAAGVPIVIAINKIDRPNIDLDKVKKQLADVDLAAEDWGGKTITINVSAKTGEGVDKLLEMILLEAEMLELSANPNKPARGIVVEGKISKGGGPIATVLVQSGTLRKGDIVVTGQYYGKVRALINDRIHRTDEAPPSMPVEILGLNGTPHAGDTFMVVEDEKKAKDICNVRSQNFKEQGLVSAMPRITLEDLYDQIQKGQVKELKTILKADVRGSLEAMADSLTNLSTKDITLNIIHKGVGDVNESDILLAAASNAIVMGFHVRTTPEASKAARTERVDLRLYSIIYEAIADIRAAMEGLLEPDIKERFMGKALIRQVFKLSKHGVIAGSFVQKGKITRGATCRLIRDNEEVYKGKVSSLKRFKDDIKDMAEGFECGIGLENFEAIKAGDIVETFVIEKIARRL